VRKTMMLYLFDRLNTLHRDSRGNVGVMMACLLPPVLGAFGIGYEVANWYLITRAMQNAADSAAVAAATNAGTNYATEATAVAAQYGFVAGVNNVTVAVSNTAACPGGGSTCYSVVITQRVSLSLTQMVGYQGNATVNGSPAQQLAAAAVASQS